MPYQGKSDLARDRRKLLFPTSVKESPKTKVTGKSTPAMLVMPAVTTTAQIHVDNAMFHLLGFLLAWDEMWSLHCRHYNSKLQLYILVSGLCSFFFVFWVETNLCSWASLDHLYKFAVGEFAQILQQTTDGIYFFKNPVYWCIGLTNAKIPFIS